MNQVRLYGKPIRVNKASADKQKAVEVGAELFVGNLDPMVTEQTLYDTFGRFGSLVAAPKVARDDSNLSKGYGFVSFSNFEASDDAIANMNGQYLMNKEISVQYAYKKDGKGERHGDQAERMLAAQARKHNIQPTAQPIPMSLFTGGVPSAPAAMLDMESVRPGNPPSMAAGGYASGRPPIPSGNNQGIPFSGQPRPPPSSQPLPAPPSGLPARPPPSKAGFGGPQGFLPPGFNAQHQQGFPPQSQGLPPGFSAPPVFTLGPPPGLPQGSQTTEYGRSR
ncbi:MAG: hypothetical protein LQ348_007622 [Seirophora lacunosa]|nr:MAG: hypothetical protein LQ348_007622 [Seirophora lacunosa]